MKDGADGVSCETVEPVESGNKGGREEEAMGSEGAGAEGGV